MPSLAAAEQALADAKFAAECPAEVELGEPLDVRLVIEPITATTGEVESMLSSADLVGTGDVLVGRKIKAVLAISPDVAIAGEISQTKQMFGETHTTFVWTCRPYGTGEHRARIEVFALQNVDGEDLEVEVRTLSRDFTVNVSSSSGFFPWLYDQIGAFWTACLGAIAVMFVAWIVGKIRKEKPEVE
ncbi:MAG: hypothetical protein AAGH99_01120 [Planctomycetota bacterium]